MFSWKKSNNNNNSNNKSWMWVRVPIIKHCRKSDAQVDRVERQERGQKNQRDLVRTSKNEKINDNIQKGTCNNI